MQSKFQTRIYLLETFAIKEQLKTAKRGLSQIARALDILEVLKELELSSDTENI